MDGRTHDLCWWSKNVICVDGCLLKRFVLVESVRTISLSWKCMVRGFDTFSGFAGKPQSIWKNPHTNANVSIESWTASSRSGSVFNHLSLVWFSIIFYSIGVRSSLFSHHIVKKCSLIAQSTCHIFRFKLLLYLETELFTLTSFAPASHIFVKWGLQKQKMLVTNVSKNSHYVSCHITLMEMFFL